MSSVLEPICRGLVGYVSFLATCKSSEVYTEYLLYEPILRIARAQGWTPRCEVAVAESASGKGAKKKIDFVLKKGSTVIAIEVKWVTNRKPDVQNDTDKLSTYHKKTGAQGYVLFFGSEKVLRNLSPKTSRTAKSKKPMVRWNAGKTKYVAVCHRYV